MGEVRQPTYRDKHGQTKTSAVWWIRYYRNGKRYEESSGSPKKTQAIKLLQVREGDGANGKPVTPQIGRFRFEEAVAAVVTDYTVNGRRSAKHVERRITKHLTPYFGGRRMADISTTTIMAFVESRQTAKASNAEINRELAILKRAFRLALKANTLLSMPYVPMLKESNARQGFFEADAFEAVRKALPEALRGVVTFAYFTGWRIKAEVLTLEWSQVDRDAQIVTLERAHSKNGAGRTFPYAHHPELVAVLTAAWTEHERLAKTGTICPWVFHRQGKPIRKFYGAWDTACDVAGVPGKIPHDLRRTAVRNLTRRGVTENVAMKLTGHKTRSVFDRYDIVNETDLANAVELLATGTVKGKSAQSSRLKRFRKSA